MKILLVDDTIDVRRAIIRYLGVCNPKYKFIEARNGKEGLSILSEIDNIDLIISDISMPIMGGVEFALQLECNFPKLRNRLIFFSSEISSILDYKFIKKPYINLLEKEVKKYESL